MRLKVINSNSSGNAYILENDKEALIIECGVRFDRIKQVMNFNLSKVVGCLVSHEHLDHSKAIVDVLKSGIHVYASRGTHTAMATINHHRAHIIKNRDQVKIGGFLVKPFDVKHDVEEPLGFLIQHAETGNVLFLTDSYYVEYTFGELHNVIIEANYCNKILNKRMESGVNPKFLRDRVIESHMSLATCKETLSANDLTNVQNIVLIHLSNDNSDEKRFKMEVEAETGKRVYIATPGLDIPFNIKPF